MMNKTVFLFPGQGSQEVGMGHDLFRNDQYFLSLIEAASQSTSEDLKRICLKGPDRKLAQTRIVQPLIVAVSLGYWRLLNEKNIQPDYILGHSLGEITGMVAAGVIDSQSAIAIAAKRGALMDEAAAKFDGGMWACLSITSTILKELIQSLKLQNELVIANINTPNQLVISGNRKAFERLLPEIIKNGGKVKKLNVAGPWHSAYMKEASDKLRAWLEPIDFQSAKIPLILNNCGCPVTNSQFIKSSLVSNLTGSVYFTQCMTFCREEAIDTFIEIGPGRVLSGLVRANGLKLSTQTYLANNIKGVDRIKEAVACEQLCPKVISRREEENTYPDGQTATYLPQ